MTAAADTSCILRPQHWYCPSHKLEPCLSVQAGMDMGIVNAQQVEADKYELIDKELLEFVEDVLLNRQEALSTQRSLNTLLKPLANWYLKLCSSSSVYVMAPPRSHTKPTCRGFWLWRCRCENATERLLEYAATLEPKSKPTNVKKLGAEPCLTWDRVAVLALGCERDPDLDRP